MLGKVIRVVKQKEFLCRMVMKGGVPREVLLDHAMNVITVDAVGHTAHPATSRHTFELMQVVYPTNALMQTVKRPS